jgi:FtsH-binding integral membrane protein
MEQMLLNIFATILLFVSTLFAIVNSAIKNKKFICNRYILNTYLYIILTLNIIALQVLLMKYNKVNFNPNLLLVIGIFILTIVCIITLHRISPKQMILKHSVWILFILLMGLMFYPMYLIYSNQQGLIMSTILTTLILFVGLSLLAYLNPNLISLSLGPVLFVLLSSGVIMELVMLFILPKNYVSKKGFKLMSYFFIGLFMMYVLYDTKRLQINAKNCIVADYISESLKLFLDIWNIFIRLLSLNRSNK